MPCAASAQCDSARSAWAAGRPASMRSTGSVSMITPVEKGSTALTSMPSSAATASQVRRARTRPSAPVPALALPVLTTKARMPLPAARCSRHTCTGAAQKRFFVNTPATALPSASSNSTRSRRLAFRMPAIAVPMRRPGTGCRARCSGALRLTGMKCVRSTGSRDCRKSQREGVGRTRRHSLRFKSLPARASVEPHHHQDAGWTHGPVWVHLRARRLRCHNCGHRPREPLAPGVTGLAAAGRCGTGE